MFYNQLFFKKGHGGGLAVGRGVGWGEGGGGAEGEGREAGKRISHSDNPMVFSKVKCLRVLWGLGEGTKENITFQGQQFMTLIQILALGG